MSEFFSVVGLSVNCFFFRCKLSDSDETENTEKMKALFLIRFGEKLEKKARSLFCSIPFLS